MCLTMQAYVVIENEEMRGVLKQNNLAISCRALQVIGIGFQLTETFLSAN